MNLLLLLSALLSALTGIAATGNAVPSAQTVSERTVATVAAAPVMARAAARPVQAVPTLLAVSLALHIAVQAAPSTTQADLLTNRRRE